MIQFLPNNISFKEWVTYVFDHPESEEAWYHLEDRVSWNAQAQPLLTIQYMTDLFTNAGTILSEYSNLQLGHGLWYIADVACSNHMQVLNNLDNATPMENRVKCIRSFFTLFEEVYARRCIDSQYNLNLNPLNLICFMWWDLVGGYAWAIHSARGEMNDSFLDTLTKVLKLNSIACQESALHGLGHWELYCRTRVWRIVTRFLRGNSDIDPNLRKYALDARRGDVL